MIRVASVNVNGVRAAFRKGMQPWLDASGVDVLALQEVRAEREDLVALLGDEWSVANDEASAKGRAGVAIATRAHQDAIRTTLGPDTVDTAGRWIEVDITTPEGNPLTIVSCYVHSGEAGTPKQDAKYEFLEIMSGRMQELGTESEYALVVGDLNVGHRSLDIRNWKGNLKNSGFLPEERAYFDQWIGGEEDPSTTPGQRDAISILVGLTAARWRAPILGGVGVGRPSTMTRAGVSITSSPQKNWRIPCVITALTEHPVMTPDGLTTRRSSPTMTSSPIR